MINSGQNATPEAIASLSNMLQMFQQNNPNNPFLKMIGGAQDNGLPAGTQTSDPTANDSLYKIKLLGSSFLGYPETGAFNLPNPKDIKASLEEKRVKGLLG
jgi:hypothetical protein